MLKVMDTIFKTNIHVHGTENLEKGYPTLFVANHFTRFETLLMPYAIHRETDTQIRSLADKSIFIGLLATYLEQTGTLSTANENRNEIIIGDLMSGRKNWLIYPEGNMIKNKKITKEKEFIMHTPAREGTIHTGAAVLALKSQMLKNELRAAMREGNDEVVDAIKRKYFLDSDELSYHSTVIVPVNISYSPLRPGDNPMMKMVSLFAGDAEIPNIMEELEIEGNLLSSGQMHIYFDKPIDMAHYIHQAKSSAGIREIADKEEQHNAVIHAFRHPLTTTFMDVIYKNVLINFDHLFITVLRHYPRPAITRQQLKRAIFMAAGDIASLGVYRLHEDIGEKLLSMLSEENHPPFENALRLAFEQKVLLRKKPGFYEINEKALKDEHDFHSVRIENTLGVVWNEVALLDTFQECIAANVEKESCEIIKEIFYRIYRKDLEIFKKDYNKFYSVISSKPKEIGSPFVLYNPEFTTGIVFSHGYLSAPEEVRALGEYLHERGYNFYGVRLKGHGTMSEDLRDSTYEQWYDSFNRGYAAMRQVSQHLFIGGFSTGGLIALLAASRKLGSIDGVICINSAMKLRDIRVRYVVPTVNALNDFLAFFNAHVEYIESEPENPHINYARNYLKSVVQLRDLMDLSFKHLETITAPTLVIQADKDPVVNPKSGPLIMEHIRSESKELYMPGFARHVITFGEGSEKVMEKVAEFIKRVEADSPRRREGDG